MFKLLYRRTWTLLNTFATNCQSLFENYMNSRFGFGFGFGFGFSFEAVLESKRVGLLSVVAQLCRSSGNGLFLPLATD